MENIAEWVAPIATMAAAMITAANLGARVTGWGFVVFLVGSLAWVAVAAASGQSNLLLSNLFLTVVNVVGIWRWLGRQATLEDGAKAATDRSAQVAAPSLFSTAMLQDQPIADMSGNRIGRIAGAMTECDSGRIAYIVVGEGGVAGVRERLHMLRWEQVRMTGDGPRCPLTAGALKALPEVTPDEWPDRVEMTHG